VPGGFGENFVTAHMNERNVCIGDVISVGPEVILQVSLPRQPCFKLNHRFSLKNFAPETYKTSRTGWYYRVLREGTVNSGDELKLVERKWPEWTIERIQEYLHRVTDNDEMNEKLADVEALGKEARQQFQRRVAKAQRRKLHKKEDDWESFKVVSHKLETPRTVSLVLEAPPKAHSEKYPIGAHAKLKLGNGLVRTYSVVSSSGGGTEDVRRLEFGIALDANSRGGSRYVHKSLKEGDSIQVGNVTSDVNGPTGAASHHVFIAGGIGITAFLHMMNRYDDINWSFQLHYAVRSSDDIPFRAQLKSYGDRVIIYDKSKGQRLDINNIMKTLPWNSYTYVCGPNRMMEAAKATADEVGISPEEIHFEAFSADTTGDPFEVTVANRNNKVIKVGEEESLLEVLKREFDDIPSSCEVGNCGTCKITVKNGEIIHRGSALLPDEKNVSMLACVSRGVGRIAIEV
jgi:ferredoxin-NADP reductase